MVFLSTEFDTMEIAYMLRRIRYFSLRYIKVAHVDIEVILNLV